MDWRRGWCWGCDGLWRFQLWHRTRCARILWGTARSATHHGTAEKIILVILLIRGVLLKAVLVFFVLVIVGVFGTIPQAIAVFGRQAVAVVLLVVIVGAADMQGIRQAIAIHGQELLRHLVTTRHDRLLRQIVENPDMRRGARERRLPLVTCYAVRSASHWYVRPITTTP